MFVRIMYMLNKLAICAILGYNLFSLLVIRVESVDVNETV
jgi:hypothetical protein